MKKLGLWVAVLSVLLWATVLTGDASAQVDETFKPKVELISPEGSSGSGQNENGESALVGSSVEVGSIGSGQTGAGLFGSDGTNADKAKSSGFWSWIADHGLGLVKGIGAGLIGAAVVGLGAVVIGVSAPVLLTVAGAAVLGGAVYGLVMGSGRFNWAEAIVGSVIAGVSAGVGSWLSAAGSTIVAKIGVAVTNVMAGGLTSLSSYLINSPERTWGGALGAFTLGSAASGVFMGMGAVASRFWTWGKGMLGLGGGARGGSSSMVQAALAIEDGRWAGDPIKVSAAGHGHNHPSRIVLGHSTGARFFPGGDSRHLDDLTRWEEYAPAAYAKIRDTTDDAVAIARKTRLPQFKIQRVKDHLFFRQHQLDGGMRHFDADPDIADAWFRLIKGEILPEDLRMIEHEYFEARFEGLFKTDYRTAHEAALRSGRDWNP